MYTTCSELLVFMYRTRNSMNNLLSYCGLVDARISACEKELPVKTKDGFTPTRPRIKPKNHAFLKNVLLLPFLSLHVSYKACRCTFI